MTHSPEPWKTDIWMDGPVQVVDANAIPVCGHVGSFDGTATPIFSQAGDLGRIVACVNACAGIPTEDLGWIPVSERLPAQNGKYLIHAPSADEDSPFIWTAWFHTDTQKWTLIAKNWADAITHWRFLPEPPK